MVTELRAVPGRAAHLRPEQVLVRELASARRKLSQARSALTRAHSRLQVEFDEATIDHVEWIDDVSNVWQLAENKFRYVRTLLDELEAAPGLDVPVSAPDLKKVATPVLKAEFVVRKAHDDLSMLFPILDGFYREYPQYELGPTFTALFSVTDSLADILKEIVNCCLELALTREELSNSTMEQVHQWLAGETESDQRSALAVTGLSHALERLRQAQQGVEDAVLEARGADVSWAEIGRLAQITPQAAYRRWDPDAKQKHRDYASRRRAVGSPGSGPEN